MPGQCTCQTSLENQRMFAGFWQNAVFTLQHWPAVMFFGFLLGKGSISNIEKAVLCPVRKKQSWQMGLHCAFPFSRDSIIGLRITTLHLLPKEAKSYSIPRWSLGLQSFRGECEVLSFELSMAAAHINSYRLWFPRQDQVSQNYSMDGEVDSKAPP